LNKVFKKEEDRKREEEEIEPAPDFSNLPLKEARKCPALSLFGQATGLSPAAKTRTLMEITIRALFIAREP
jgi:hypothetical protein